ncbi:MAG: PAS domain S-box protein, partial [Methylomonas sp.]|nr:PAS domain S-box protein [Methylomonas sp.]
WRGGSADQRKMILAGFEAFSRLCHFDHASEPGFLHSYWLATNGDFFGVYPWQPSNEALAWSGISIHNGASTALTDELLRKVSPDQNVQGRDFWLSPRSSGGPSGILRHAAPVLASAKLAAIVAVDWPLTEIQSALTRWSSSIGRLLILDENDFVLADSAGMEAGHLLQLPQLNLPRLDRSQIDTGLAAGKPHANHGSVLMAREVSGAPLHLVTLVGEGELAGLLWPQLFPYALILIALGATLSLSLFALRREFITPALSLVTYLQQLARDPKSLEPSVPQLWQPWVKAISHTFTSHRSALQQLRAGEAFKSAIVENSMLAVISMDQQGMVMEFNRAAEQVFGISAEQALGADLADLIIPERYRAAHRAGLQRHIETGRSKVIGAHLALSALHADGHEFPIELTIFVTPVDQQSFFTAFVADHTQRKQAEEEVARQREALRQSEKLSAMGALLAGVAHELNNPLAILMGRAALLEDKTQDSELQSDAARIRAAADRCGRIVKTFLSMARQKPAERKWALLNEVATGAVELLGYGLRSAGIELTLELDPDLAPVEMDSDQIGQVLVNLVVNAQQALSSVVPTPRLRLQTGQEADGQFLRVADNGPGVPEELCERIFDPFFTTKLEGTGTGIGLSVSRAILREHGGELVLEKTGLGASFLLRLPINERRARPRGAKSANEREEICHEGMALIVDDEPEVAAVLADILRSAGYEVHVASSGNQAMQWLEQNRCNLLFSDVRMPDMDGITLWRTLRDRHPELVKHMALVTGDTLSANIAPLIAETGLPCLEKPFLPEEILQLAARIEV